MARITVEDCIRQIPNRFEMVMLAAHRTRQIAGGAPLLLERDHDKNHVVALREIAETKTTKDELRTSMVAKLCRYNREVIGEEASGSQTAATEMSEEEMLRRLPGMRNTATPAGGGL